MDGDGGDGDRDEDGGRDEDGDRGSLVCLPQGAWEGTPVFLISPGTSPAMSLGSLVKVGGFLPLVCRKPTLHHGRGPPRQSKGQADREACVDPHTKHFVTHKTWYLLQGCGHPSSTLQRPRVSSGGGWRNTQGLPTGQVSFAHCIISQCKFKPGAWD